MEAQATATQHSTFEKCSYFFGSDPVGPQTEIQLKLSCFLGPKSGYEAIPLGSGVGGEQIPTSVACTRGMDGHSSAGAEEGVTKSFN